MFFNDLHVLVEDLAKRETLQTPAVQNLVHEGFLLDMFWFSDQRLLDKPRVTLGNSIELFSVVTSPSPLKPEELNFPLKTAD